LVPTIRDEVYRIAREVLRNAFRHAHARRIEAEILYDEQQFRLRVRDDGKGMDPQVLERAAHANRVLVSHDRRTMLRHFRERLEAGSPTAGLLIVAQHVPIAAVAEAIIVLWAASEPVDLRDQAYHLQSLHRHASTS